ncbi:PepSY-associated TM helix domain-containing protein [Streptomyces sp. NBC_01102]|uniref:PepSY-associated TM helix domain-containing protein n=1 Tax=Streptomyces sp. NBC_01102 TaxID=2903749 RepID=UPI00386D8513
MRCTAWHGRVWAALGLFMLSATGLTWSTYAGASISDLRTALGQTTATVGEHAEHSGAGARRPTGPRVWGRTPCWRPPAPRGCRTRVEIVPPADASSAYVVRQIRRSRPEKQDAVAIDPASGQDADVQRWADYPVLAKLSRWGVDVHTGSLFGLANQIVLAALTLALIVLGYRMWWQRGLGSSFGRPLPRGAWQHVPPYVLVPPMAAIAVLGYLVPLLRIPPAAFLLVDVVWGEVEYRRGRRRAAGASAADG